MGKLELRTKLWQPIGRLRVLRHPNQPADAVLLLLLNLSMLTHSI